MKKLVLVGMIIFFPAFFWSKNEQLSALAKKSKRIDYSIVKLPDNFHVHSNNTFNILNDSGQVVGFCGKTNNQLMDAFDKNMRNINRHIENDFDPYAGDRAACWSETCGLSLLDIRAYKSIAVSINIDGVAAVSLYEERPRTGVETIRVYSWNTETNEIKKGPVGTAYYNNDANEVLVNMYQGKFIWRPHNNTIFRDPRDEIERRFPCIFNSSNKNGIKLLTHNADISLVYNGEEHLLSMTEGKVMRDVRRAFLNNNDDVIAMTVVNRCGIECNVFTIWHKDTELFISKPLQDDQELKVYKYFRIVGFNSRGQVLLKCATENSYSDHFCYSDLFLMTPK